MGITRVGRTQRSETVTAPGISTGSAYSALDAVGSAFEIPYAVGDGGGLVAQVGMRDGATGNAALRLHFFAAPPGAQVNGDTWVLANADVNQYLGYIDAGASDWVSAGGNRSLAQVTEPNIALWNNSGNRSIWCQIQCIAAPTFGNSASALTLWLVTIQD